MLMQDILSVSIGAVTSEELKKRLLKEPKVCLHRILLHADLVYDLGLPDLQRENAPRVFESKQLLPPTARAVSHR